jgi:hypothetical protein
MKSTWITYQTSRIFLMDFSNFGHDTAGLIAEIQAAEKACVLEPPASVLTLVDVRNSVIALNAVLQFKATGKAIQPHIQKMAMLGVTGLRLILAKSINQYSGLTTAFFQTPEEAQGWLIAEKA